MSRFIRAIICDQKNSRTFRQAPHRRIPFSMFPCQPRISIFLAISRLTSAFCDQNRYHSIHRVTPWDRREPGCVWMTQAMASDSLTVSKFQSVFWWSLLKICGFLACVFFQLGGLSARPFLCGLPWLNFQVEAVPHRQRRWPAHPCCTVAAENEVHSMELLKNELGLGHWSRAFWAFFKLISTQYTVVYPIPIKLRRWK